MLPTCGGDAAALSHLARCARALAALAGPLPSQRWSLLTPAGVRASWGAAGLHPGPGAFWSRVPHRAGWAGYCSVGSPASGPVMRAPKLLSPGCNERQRLPPGVPEPSALKPSQIFHFSKLHRSFWMFTGCSVGAVSAERGLSKLWLGGFRTPDGPAPCWECPLPVPRAAGAFPVLLFHH